MVRCEETYSIGQKGFCAWLDAGMGGSKVSNRLLGAVSVHRGSIDTAFTDKGLRLPSDLLEERYVQSPSQVESQVAKLFPMPPASCHIF